MRLNRFDKVAFPFLVILGALAVGFLAKPLTVEAQDVGKIQQVITQDFGAPCNQTSLPTDGQAWVYSSTYGAWLAGTVSGAAFGPQTANTVFSGPTSGGAANPTFRSLVAADLGTTMSPTFNAVTATSLLGSPTATLGATSTGALTPTSILGSPASTLGATTVTTLGGTGALSGFTTGTFSGALTTGLAGTGTGSLVINGTTSGSTKITVAPVAGSPATWTLPTATAAAGGVLTDAAGNGTLSWAVPATATLQAAYNGGNAILVATANGAVALSDATDATDLLTLTRTFAGGGNGASVSMGATTTGNGLNVTMTGGATGSAVNVAGGTQTTNAPVLNVAQTWNAGAVLFQGIKANFTNTASAVTSRPLDIQVDGTSLMLLDVAGCLKTAGTITDSANTYSGVQDAHTWNGAATYVGFDSLITDTASGVGSQLFRGRVNSSTVFYVDKVGCIALGSGGTALTASSNSYYGYEDRHTWNGAAGFVAFKATITDTSSNAASYLFLGTVGGSTIFDIDKTGSVLAMGTLTASTANIYGFKDTHTWNDSGTAFKGVWVNVTNTASAAGARLADLQVASSSKWSADVSGNVIQAGTLTTSGNILPNANGTLTLGTVATGWKQLYADYTNTATVGNVTINKMSGRVNLAAAGTTLTVTNSLVTAASHIFLNLDSAPGNVVAVVPFAVPGAGSFTINVVPAVTNQTAIDFFVVNAD